MLEKLGINPYIVIAQLINFWILIYLLNKILYKPIMDILNKREQTIKESLSEAERANQILREAEENKNKIISDAKTLAWDIIEKAKITAQSQADEILEKTKKSTADAIKSAREVIESEKVKMFAEVEWRLIELSMLVVNKVLSEKLPDNVYSKALSNAMNEFKK